jgi:hypothetical protein
MTEIYAFSDTYIFDSSVSIATGYGIHGRGSISGRGKSLFLYSTIYRPVLDLTQPPIQWVQGIKRPGHETDHSPPSSVKVNNGSAIPPISAWRGA